MAELGQQLQRIRDSVQPAWSPARQDRIEQGVARRRRRRRVARALGAAAVACAAVLLVLLGGHPLRPGPVHFVDGSSATLLERGSAVHLVGAQAGRLSVSLAQGAARFRVVPDRKRVFRVEAGAVAVEVLGTQFVVTRRGDRTTVAVEEGRVRVRWAAGETLLGPGEHGTFPPEPQAPPPGLAMTTLAAAALDPPAPLSEPGATAPAAPAAEPDAGAPGLPTAATSAAPAAPAAPAIPAAPAAEPVLRRRTAPPPEPPRWQDLAQEGDYDRAFGALREAPAPRDEPQELLLAADVARLSHHPEQAVAPLSQILARHRDDRRTPLAAFTLGRLLLDALGQPRPAAAAFQTVQELDPDGPLSQDALAREVEAWSRAGDDVLARQRALQYVRRYPTGPRLRAVRRHGGLE